MLKGNPESSAQANADLIFGFLIIKRDIKNSRPKRIFFILKNEDESEKKLGSALAVENRDSKAESSAKIV